MTLRHQSNPSQSITLIHPSIHPSRPDQIFRDRRNDRSRTTTRSMKPSDRGRLDSTRCRFRRRRRPVSRGWVKKLPPPFDRINNRRVTNGQSMYPHRRPSVMNGRKIKTNKQTHKQTNLDGFDRSMVSIDGFDGWVSIDRWVRNRASSNPSNPSNPSNRSIEPIETAIEGVPLEGVFTHQTHRSIKIPIETETENEKRKRVVRVCVKDGMEWNGMEWDGCERPDRCGRRRRARDSRRRRTTDDAMAKYYGDIAKAAKGTSMTRDGVSWTTRRDATRECLDRSIERTLFESHAESHAETDVCVCVSGARRPVHGRV